MRNIVKFALIIPGLLLFIGFGVPIPHEVEADMREYYIRECLEAHKHNKTYLLCSGWWRNPDPSDLGWDPAVHPLENPYEEIGHGSCVSWNRKIIFVFGVHGWLNRPWYG